MTKANFRLPPGVVMRSLTRLDAWRISERQVLPRECAGFVASCDGEDIAAGMVARGHDCWWVCAWFPGDTLRRYRHSVYRLALMWVAGLAARDLDPLCAVSDAGVPDNWFRRLGFVPSGRMTDDGREVWQWRGRP